MIFTRRLMNIQCSHFTKRIITFSGHRNTVKRLCKFSTNSDSFVGEKDRYNGVTVDIIKEKCEDYKFSTKLQDSLNKWNAEGIRCVWFKIDIKNSAYVPILAQKGFTFHHARDDFVMMYKWLPTDSQANLPPSSHTNLGIGAIVLNNKEQILAVTERYYGYPHWKLPGGYVERGEDIIDAAMREVKEETGVSTAFQSLVTIRHTHNMMYGNSDIYVLLMMEPLTEEIVISQREIKACQWMDINDYITHPHVHEFNKLILKKALEYKHNKLKLDMQKKTVKWAQFVREMNFMVIGELK